ncbi:MAG: ABC transporter substrate-binding protein [Solirubrobacteraceae bacterium]
MRAQVHHGLAAGACVLSAIAIAACGGTSSHAAQSSAHTTADSQAADARTQTPAATKSVSSLTWFINPYPPSSFDPVKYNDYPEDNIIPNMCESLVRQVPGMKTVPWLARSWSQPNPTTLVFKLQKGVHFWDGTPMTSADVVFSLKRNLEPSAQSIYGTVFQYVKSMTATGPDTFTIKFSKPDVTFLPEMATLASAVVEPAYVQRVGTKFGTPAGGLMCTGPYKFASWNGTSSAVMTANPNYWDKAAVPKVKTITFQWPTDAGQTASGYQSGAAAGGFFLSTSVLPTLKSSSAGKLYIGPDSQAMEVMALIVVGTKGAIENPLVRRALYMSIDRTGLITAAEAGAGTPGYADASPGYFSYAASQYTAAYQSLATAGDAPAQAKKLAAQAGAVAKQPIVLAIPAGSQEVADVGQVVQQSADAAGLNVHLKTVPLDQYGALFSDPSTRKGDDLIFTINYDQDPDPLAIYDDIAQPAGISNFNHYDNPNVVRLLDEARGTTDLTKRAALVIQAQRLVMQDLPWIPLDFRPNTAFVRSGICGVPLDFSMMASPWAASVGGC